MRAAAQRGVLIHSLLERLPAVAKEDRVTRATAWLERQASTLDASERSEILSAALKVLGEPGFEALFSAESLAEVPLAATVDGQVIAGVADRLLVTPETVTVVDFKTARRPPWNLEQVPAATIRQMSAYVAALEVIYPERKIVATLLYTQTPQLITIPSDVLDVGKSGLSTKQESFPALPVE
jgi:ATP-dependent helicase/nuclease subunit A